MHLLFHWEPAYNIYSSLIFSKFGLNLGTNIQKLEFYMPTYIFYHHYLIYLDKVCFTSIKFLSEYT